MPDPIPPAAPTAEQLAAAKTEAVAAYKKHRAAVLALPEAKGREALAETLIETGLSVDQIKTSLAAAPAPKAEVEEAEEEDETEDPAPNPEAYERSRAAASAGLAKPAGKTGTKGGDIASRVLGNYGAVTGRYEKKSA